jgi:hypothetical protein
MTFYGSEEHEPVTWVRGHAIYAAHLVVLVFIASMLVTTVLMFSQAPSIVSWVMFSSESVLRGQVWRVFSYGLWNPPSLWFAIDMLMLVWFGRELEKFFGRRKFLALYCCIYLLPPLLFTALSRWFPTTLAGETGAFAIFIAFATLYPNVPLFFTLLARWVAIVLVALYTLIALSARNWETLISLWATSGFAYLFVRYAQGILNLPRLRLPRRKPKLHVVREPAPPRSAPVNPPSASMAEIDALLDKIAQSGIGSLTAKERAKLDAARRDLKKRSDA